MTAAAPRHDLFAAGPGGSSRAIGRALATHRPAIASVLVWALALVTALTSSYPSGHTASALTLCVGAAVVLTSFICGTPARTLVWVFPILLLGLLAVRSVAVAATELDHRVTAPPPACPPPEVAS